MADRIIIVGVKRGNERVPVSELFQMAGRGGRKHGGTCEAHFVIEDDEYDNVVAEMEDNPDFTVLSTMDSPETLAFHLLPEICDSRVNTLEDAHGWYARSLGCYQGKIPKLDKALEMLVSTGAIENKLDDFIPTGCGKIASHFYFHPLDICDWRNNFNNIFEMGLECSDEAIAWALGSTSYTRISGDFGKYWHIVGELKDNLPLGLKLREGTTITATLWWSAIRGIPVGKMKNQVVGLRDNFSRIHAALLQLDEDVCHWNRKDFFNELLARVQKGIPQDLVELCRLPGITKGRAAYLCEMGIHNATELKESLDNILCEVDEKFAKILQEAAAGA
jgi:hypothetical protein